MKYVILGQLGGIGGWQLYIDSRAEHIKILGYKVYLVSISEEKDIILPGLKNMNYFCLPEIHMPPSSYSIKQRDEIVNRLLDYIGENDTDVIIESTDVNLSMWGEIIAQHYQGKNYSYLLHSHLPLQNRSVQDFFYFKYCRHELAGMSKNTLPDLFYLHPAKHKIEPRHFFASIKDPLTDENLLPDLVDTIVETKKKNDAFVIGYFGNLGKPHFISLCGFLEDFFSANSSQQFLFISIGSSGNGISEKRMDQICKKVSNCNVLNVPSMHPVPTQLFGCMDVCIASWGCAEVAARTNALTIRLLDDVTIRPQGLVGVHQLINNQVCSESLEAILKKILRKDYCLENIHYKNEFDYSLANRIIDDEIIGLQNKREYYDISSIKKVSTRSAIERGLNRIFGVACTRKIEKVLKVLLAKPYALIQEADVYERK